MKSRGQIFNYLSIFGVILLVGQTLSCQSYRDNQVEPDRLLNILGVEKGMKIGEAGAGSGYLTIYLAEKVGGTGHIYANDIDDSPLQTLKTKAAGRDLTNITTVAGEQDDPLFPVNDLDMVVMLQAFHEFENKVDWLKNAKKYLKPDGSLVILDAWFDDGRTMTKEFIEETADKAGYQFDSYDPYLRNVHIFVLKTK